jgi:hypothetical protein
VDAIDLGQLADPTTSFVLRDQSFDLDRGWVPLDTAQLADVRTPRILKPRVAPHLAGLPDRRTSRFTSDSRLGLSFRTAYEGSLPTDPKRPTRTSLLGLKLFTVERREPRAPHVSPAAVLDVGVGIRWATGHKRRGSTG